MLEIFKFTTTAIASICLFGSVVLFFRSRGNRARKFLATLTLMWGVGFAILILSPLQDSFSTPAPMKTNIIAGGLLALVLFLIYPIEILRPKWLNTKRLLMIASPALLLYTVYTIYRFQFSEMIHIDQWLRVIFIIMNLSYGISTLIVIQRNIKNYNKELENNFSTLLNHRLEWLRGVAIALTILTLVWVNWIINGGLIAGNIYMILMLFTISTTIYRGLFHESAYLYLKTEEKRAKSEGEEVLTPQSFKEIAEKIEEWMQTEKPYLRQDLQLSDLVQVLRINRTYTSRIFNECLGTTFSSYVRMKRIEHAKRILMEQPYSTIDEVAKQSGFYSASTMHKAFSTIVGETATQFRKKNFKSNTES